MKDTQKMKCENCKHWDSETLCCNRIPDDSESSSYIFKESDDIAVTTDGDNNMSSLYCKKDFGCVLFKVKK